MRITATKLLLCVCAATATLLASGCVNYARNRANDALDMFEPGFTVSAKPGFAVFTDCYSVLPFGYGHVEGKKLGFGNRQLGVLDYELNAWGALFLAGRYQQGVGEFNPRDPHQARKDQRDAETWPTYSMGVLGLALNWDPRPLPAFLECDKTIHLGWIGFSLKYRVFDIFDFLAGFTTLDVMGDDLAGKDGETTSGVASGVGGGCGAATCCQSAGADAAAACETPSCGALTSGSAGCESADSEPPSCEPVD